MNHKHINSFFISNFLSYNIAKDDISDLIKTFPTISSLGNNPELINGYVKGQLRKCSGCRKIYAAEVRKSYDLVSNQRYQRNEPPIELRDFDPLNIAHLVLLK